MGIRANTLSEAIVQLRDLGLTNVQTAKLLGIHYSTCNVLYWKRNRKTKFRSVLEQLEAKEKTNVGKRDNDTDRHSDLSCGGLSRYLVPRTDGDSAS